MVHDAPPDEGGGFILLLRLLSKRTLIFRPILGVVLDPSISATLFDPRAPVDPGGGLILCMQRR
jgi:hypothetical protein